MYTLVVDAPTKTLTVLLVLYIKAQSSIFFDNGFNTVLVMSVQAVGVGNAHNRQRSLFPFAVKVTLRL